MDFIILDNIWWLGVFFIYLLFLFIYLFCVLLMWYILWDNLYSLFWNCLIFYPQSVTQTCLSCCAGELPWNCQTFFWHQLTWHFIWPFESRPHSVEEKMPGQELLVPCLHVLFWGMHFLYWSFDFEHTPLPRIPMGMHFNVIWVTYVPRVKIIDAWNKQTFYHCFHNHFHVILHHSRF